MADVHELPGQKAVLNAHVKRGLLCEFRRYKTQRGCDGLDPLRTAHARYSFIQN